MVDLAPLPLDEASERRKQIRLIVNLPGHIVFTRRRAAGGSPPESACRLVNISPGGMMIAVETSVSQGEPVVAHIIEFGRLEGFVIRSLAGGFAMSVVLDDASQDRLAAKLLWMERRQRNEVRDLRRHSRRVPRNNQSTLLFADGTITRCHIADMSCSGVAVVTGIAPAIGTPLAVGKVVGRVIRQFDNGFAVQFIDVQDDRTLDKMLIAPHAGSSGLSFGDVIVPAEGPMTPRAPAASQGNSSTCPG